MQDLTRPEKPNQLRPELSIDCTPGVGTHFASSSWASARFLSRSLVSLDLVLLVISCLLSSSTLIDSFLASSSCRIFSSNSSMPPTDMKLNHYPDIIPLMIVPLARWHGLPLRMSQHFNRKSPRNVFFGEKLFIAKLLKNQSSIRYVSSCTWREAFLEGANIGSTTKFELLSGF